jgi:hypothetical protein
VRFRESIPIDENLVKEVSDKAIILEKGFEPINWLLLSKNKTKKISSGIPRKQSFLDKTFLWIRESFSRCARFKTIGCLFEKYILDNDIDTIITSGPPHSLHLIGLELKQN